MNDQRKFEDDDLQEVWDRCEEFEKVFFDRVEKASKLGLENRHLQIQVQQLEDELLRYKTLVETHETSIGDWLAMITRANKIEGEFSNLEKENQDLKRALENEKKLRIESEVLWVERWRKKESELKREIQDAVNRIVAEKDEEFRVQMEKYKEEIRQSRRSLDKLKTSPVAKAQVEPFALKQKCLSRSSPVESSSGSIAAKGNAVGRSLLTQCRVTDDGETLDLANDLVDDETPAMKTSEESAPVRNSFKKKLPILSFPVVKKKKLLSNRGDYL